MVKWIKSILLIVIISFTFQPAAAQEEDFIVQIVTPGEGETIYAGPSSLLFSIPVSGIVRSSRYDFDQISIKLEAIKDGQLIGIVVETLTHYDTFDFYLTANPDATDDEFDPMHASCVAYCHVRSELSLPTGHLLLRVTATTPTGVSAIAERKIIVDHSNYVDVPVKVVFDDGSESVSSGIPIKASTWLYMWRARSATGSTDDQGNALVSVEALAEAPTHWVFSIPPVVLDGVRYVSTDSVELTINPGMSDPPPILLRVTSQKGEIDGKLTNNRDREFALKAVGLSTGEIRETLSSKNGSFSFTNLLIDRYVLVVDSGVDQENLLAYPQSVDLTIEPEVNVNIPILQLNGVSIHGRVVDEQSLSIPFAWITIENTSYIQNILPDNGDFSILGLTGEMLKFQLRSPGYYSDEKYESLENLVNSSFEMKLKPQDGTEFLSWGDGKITLPSESEFALDDDMITLEKGWVWGHGKGTDLIIRSALSEIKMNNARFAYEFLPNQSAWLFVFDGSAEIRSRNGSEQYSVNANQMVNLLDQKSIVVLPYDPGILTALKPIKSVPIPFSWEETLVEKVQQFLKTLGYNFAQLIIYIAYSVILIALVFFPVKFLIQWVKQKKQRDKIP